MSVPSDRLPAQISPLASKGTSIDPKTVSCAAGLLTNIDDFLRPPSKAKRIRNFHQFTRGVFSSSGGGWIRDNASGINANAVCLDFGAYVDALGNQYLLAQFGTKAYFYNTGTHAATALPAPFDALNATALPCMRPAQPTLSTTNPFTVYCNGIIEPYKIYNATAGSAPNTATAMRFHNGFYTNALTITGAVVAAGDINKLTITGTSLTVSPTDIKYTAVANDALSDVAGGIARAINLDASCASAGLTATASSNVVVMSWGIELGTTPFTFAWASTGVEAGAFAAGSTTPVFPGVFNGLTYTKPKFCEPFFGRMAYAGFDNGGASGNAVANQLLISSLGNVESFRQSTPVRATDAWTVPIPPILGKVTALRHFRPLTNVASEVLIVGCENGMCVVTGTDATTFALQIQSDQFGIPSNRTFVQLDNIMLFMASDGFRYYNGSNNTTNLIANSISLDIYDEFLKVDRTNWHKAHAVHHRDTQEVWFWVPYTGPDGDPTHGDSGKPAHAFIYNYNSLDGSPIWYTVDNTICMASIEFLHIFYGGNDIGLVQKWYGVNNYDDIVRGAGGESNVIPGAEIVLSLVGTGNPSQFCSIQHVVVGASANDQKFLINAATYELMDDGSTRLQQMRPYNYTLKSISVGQTALGPATPAWILNTSAFPSKAPKFLQDYVPIGHGRLWEFSLLCNDSSHNLDFTFLEATISIGGQRV